MSSKYGSFLSRVLTHSAWTTEPISPPPQEKAVDPETVILIHACMPLPSSFLHLQNKRWILKLATTVTNKSGNAVEGRTWELAALNSLSLVKWASLLAAVVNKAYVEQKRREERGRGGAEERGREGGGGRGIGGVIYVCVCLWVLWVR